MRRIFCRTYSAVLAVMLVLAGLSCAYGDASLYRGSSSIGSVQTLEKGGGYFVPVEDVGRLFGFAVSRSGEEVVLSRGSSQVRVMANSAAAWRGVSIVPMYSAPFENKGRLWVDVQSAVSIFQSFAGAGQSNRLRFVQNTGALAQKVSIETPAVRAEVSDRELAQLLGLPSGESEAVQMNNAVSQAQSVQSVRASQITVSNAQTQTQQTNNSVSQTQPVQNVKASQITVSNAQTQPQQTNNAVSQPQTVQSVRASQITVSNAQTQSQQTNNAVSQTQSTQNVRASQTPAQNVNNPASQPQASQTVSTPAIQTQDSQTVTQTISSPAVQTQDSQTPTQTAAKTKKATSYAKKQPRLETFRPGDKKTDKTESYSGIIQGIRWTHSEGTYNKIMAVVQADDEADPQVFISGNSIHALFSGCLDNAEGLTSPYSNIKAEINRNNKGTELIFTPSGMTKAEKLVLNNPRRIAFDFFYPDNVKITEAGSTTTAQVTQPQRQAPSIPQVPANQTPRRTSPAVNTRPSTLTIPMTPAGTRRNVIVVDPGHGGKDPGASDNGVTEKNVNLAVGLELEKVLTARGYKVVMTRNTDVYLTLQERTDIANRENADLFVSVHVNALPNKKSMTGFEIYIMALPTDKDAMNLAKIENREYVEGKGMDVANVDRRTEMLLRILGDMQQNNKISESTDFAAALYNAGTVNGLPMRRIAQAPFFVLRGAGMPAVLLEIGFVTNEAESRLLMTPNYQNKIATAMAAGIVNYLK